mmetsp:Transcript_62394/g.197035  ORF Transcript_62394/g.197035 Transcript_62394/m.197035 type:complete len:215 (-) Transcript_62394:531-1175(-)
MRQCASWHLKPSFTIVVLVSRISENLCSTGLPKNSPRLFWLLNLSCSMAQAAFSLIASAIWKSPSESRPFVSMFSTRSVAFLLIASASPWPWGFMTLAFARFRMTMLVLCASAFISLGAMRGSMCGGGIHLLAKLKSVSDGSFSQARCTIQIIQSPRLLLLPGSSHMSAMSVTSSISAANFWFTPVTSSISFAFVTAKFSSVLQEPAGFVAVTV